MSMMFRKKLGNKNKGHGLGQHNDYVPPSPGLVPMPWWIKTSTVEKSVAWQQSKAQLPQHVDDFLPNLAHALKAHCAMRPEPCCLEPERSLTNDANAWSWSLTTAPSVDLLIARSPGSPQPRLTVNSQHGAHSQRGSFISSVQEFKEIQAYVEIKIDEETDSKWPLPTHPSSKVSAHHFPADRADCSPSNPSTQWLSKDGHADPKLKHAQSLALAGYGLRGYATVMVQRVPFKYSQKKFVREIHEAGFEGAYDFLYLPSNARSRGSRGFGFINFLSPGLAEEFYLRYMGRKLKQMSEPQPPLVIVPADVQGFEQSAERYFSSWHHRSTQLPGTKSIPVFYKAVCF